MFVIIHKQTALLVRFVETLTVAYIQNFAGLVNKFSISCLQN